MRRTCTCLHAFFENYMLETLPSMFTDTESYEHVTGLLVLSTLVLPVNFPKSATFDC